VNRTSLGSRIAAGLASERSTLHDQFHDPRYRVHAFVLDQVLDADTCRAVHDAFPDPDDMRLRKSLRERKYVSAQMNRHDPLLEEIVYAFQQPKVVEQLATITAVSDLAPDEHLYAGGISTMGPGHFLKPHIDNSHDKDRLAYRVLNLLYYATPGWRPEDGGSLQLWDDGPRRPAGRAIPCVSNRLVVMGTTRRSWHSVSPITHDGYRCCVSNYYFSPVPLADDVDGDGRGEHFHPTTFRGFPDQHWQDVLLRADGRLRSGVRRVRKGGLVATKHLYQRGD
jgi:Rps23 Pro-64 3,4-dihydroxylase Tpa1-like proline 4-hydroxylase